ncbi:MAG TPA: SDR family NAD(P)-dependent oxidoreductase, partial [Thermoguttaceae bacterium]|nr:SDR family NAD(P)-dependent oxidoreductase [Thermoguttaceae bacterium]
MSHLEGQVILVTGGTSGIGEACTELFAEHGARVIAMSIQADQGQALAQRLQAQGRTCLFHYGDVRREEDVRAAVDLALQQFGRLDAVCANAGVLRTQKITEITMDDFNLVMGVNLLGP